MMISFSSMNLMVSVCKWFVLLMWLLKCQWRSEKKTFPLFLKNIRERRNEDVLSLECPAVFINLLESAIYLPYTIANTSNNCEQSSDSVLWLVQDLPF